MSEMTCPACGHAASGRFCSNCGASLPGKVTCASCGNEIPAGGRFCNQCGTPTPAASVSATPAAPPPPPAPAATAATPASQRPASTLPWVVASLAVLALVIALVVPDSEPADPVAGGVAPAASAPAGEGGEFGDARAVDLSAMSPRERADALFNRVMRNVSAGDSTQARFFLPMALAAYEDVPELDADGHYHMAVLHLAGGDARSARARADSILAETPTHLFGLFTAAQAEQAMGNTAAARELYARLSQVFSAESSLARTEYTEHEAVMPLMREEAVRALGER